MCNESAPRTALVVEDNDLFANLLKQFLESSGYVVTIASDGREAWRLLRERTFSLHLLDLKLPDGGIFDLLTSVEMDPGVAGRSLIVTAYPTVAAAVSTCIPIVDKSRIDELGGEIAKIAEHQAC